MVNINSSELLGDRDIQHEINRHKWIESEKVGYDIGYERAAREWVSKHFHAWRKPHWNRLIAEALRSH